MALRFNIKDPAESVPLTFDFSPGLPSGVTLNGSPNVGVTTFAGTDGNPAALLNGAVGFDATLSKVVQPVTAGLNNCDYEWVVTCPTTNPYLTLTIVAILSVRR